MWTETRGETCPECGDRIDREWSVQVIAKGTPVPKGWRVQPRRGAGDAWRTIAAPTRWATLCLCDAP
jgi:hypothetical protein